MIEKWISSVPKMILGPILVVVAILYFFFSDPPKTVCDTQFDIFKTEMSKYIFGYEKKGIKVSAGIKKDMETCQKGASPGTCFDWLTGLKKTILRLNNIPNQCGERMADLDPLNSWLDFSVFLFSQISWNDSATTRQGLYGWIEEDDIVLYCRLQREYRRLRGEVAWNGLQNRLLNDLIRDKKMPKEQAWERTILSYHCR